MVSNHSKMSNSARNGKKKFGGSGQFSALSAVSPQFLHSSLINIIKATAIPNLTAVSHYLAEFMRFKVAHPPPPFIGYSVN